MDQEGRDISWRRRRLSSEFDAIGVEPFVRSDLVGQYLRIDAATVVRYAKAGILPGHPLRVSGHRTHWRFLLSEIRRAMLEKEPKPLRVPGLKSTHSTATSRAVCLDCRRPGRAQRNGDPLGSEQSFSGSSSE